MGSYSLWLLFVALLLLVRIAPAYCQHTEDVEDHRLTFLVTIKSNGSGLEIHTRFPGNQGNEGSRSQPELEFQTYFIPNRSLSSECGDQYFRCQRLLVEPLSIQNASRNVNIVFVPLEGAVLLLSYWYDSDIMTLKNSSFMVNSSNCSPTAFYKISSKIYTVCISPHYFRLYEVQLQSLIFIIHWILLTLSSSEIISTLLLTMSLLSWAIKIKQSHKDTLNYKNAHKFTNSQHFVLMMKDIRLNIC